MTAEPTASSRQGPFASIAERLEAARRRLDGSPADDRFVPTDGEVSREAARLVAASRRDVRPRPPASGR